jgi:hypothetical protein
MLVSGRTTAALLSLTTATAWANGAFPDSQNMFAPADQPNRLLLSTNFGLIQSVDNGVTWDIFCEIGELAPNAFLYEVGPPPDHRLVAVSENGLSYSDDNGCDWALIDGGIPANSVIDAFIDPSDGTHLLAIAEVELPDGGLPPEGVYESHTGGASFSPTPLFSAPPNSFLTGVEISASQPATSYAVHYIVAGSNYRPFVDRSDNSGQTWVQNELTGQLGSVTLRLAAVDSEDPSVVYLRQTSPNNGLVIATDGGAAAQLLLGLDAGELMTAFLKREDGSLIVCQRTTVSGGHDGCFLSTDDGVTWNEYLWSYHVRALAERDGGLYVAGDNYEDGFAVGLLLDDGGIQTLLQYQGVCDLEQCGEIPNTCALWWVNQQNLLQIPATVCGKMPPPEDSGAADGGQKAPGKSCGCSAQDMPLLFLATIFATVCALARSRSTRRRHPGREA